MLSDSVLVSYAARLLAEDASAEIAGYGVCSVNDISELCCVVCTVKSKIGSVVSFTGNGTTGGAAGRVVANAW